MLPLADRFGQMPVGTHELNVRVTALASVAVDVRGAMNLTTPASSSLAIKVEYSPKDEKPLFPLPVG